MRACVSASVRDGIGWDGMRETRRDHKEIAYRRRTGEERRECGENSGTMCSTVQHGGDDTMSVK